MLFDPKWEVQTRPDVFSLESLITWLEKQPADKAYCYADRGHCLAAQFNAHCAREYPSPFGGAWTKFDSILERISQGECIFSDRTFGAALARARAALVAA